MLPDVDGEHRIPQVGLASHLEGLEGTNGQLLTRRLSRVAARAVELLPVRHGWCW